MDSAEKWAKWSDRKRVLKEIHKKIQKKLSVMDSAEKFKVGKMVR